MSAEQDAKLTELAAATGTTKVQAMRRLIDASDGVAEQNVEALDIAGVLKPLAVYGHGDVGALDEIDRALELRWLGRLLAPGIFDGEHSFLIEPREGGRSRFVMAERFTGVLVGFLKGTVAKTESGFEQMNAALKARVEQPSAQN